MRVRLPTTAAKAALKISRLIIRLRNRLFTDAVSGAFHTFGHGSTIQLPATIWGESAISIGDRVHVGPGSWLLCLADDCDGADPLLRIGNGSSFAGGVTITAAKSVWIGDDVLVGRNVHISDHAHEFRSGDKPISRQGITNPQPVWIGDGAWLGQGVVICPGVRIGRNCVIGANSVVKSDIPDRCVAVGAPARVVRSLDPS